MRKPPKPPVKFLAAVLMLGGAAGLHCLPESLSDLLRASLHDAVHPGARLLHWSLAEGRGWVDQIRSAPVDPSRITELEVELAASRTETQSARVQAALLREKLAELEKLTTRVQPSAKSEALFVSELLPALVLGEGTRALWREGNLIDKGTAHGLTESLLVLDDARTIIDQGESTGVEPEQEVYAGQTVVGRIATVGRWTSSVERVTDRNYRGLAQIARQTAAGLVFGAEGILEGDGSATCRLREIPVTDSVEVGDDVYTGGRDGRIRAPMYYGKVVEARLNDGATAWEIRVQPAVGNAPLRAVNVLRTKLNPHRMLAQ